MIVPLPERFAEFRYVVVITGAGISAESGIPTFRGAGGLWRNYRAEDLATPSAFRKDPQLVWEWYEMRREICRQAEPNAAHQTLVEMERYFSAKGSFLLVTQNVDGLHRRAGNENIVEIHGSIWRVRCTECGRECERLHLDTVPPHCLCGGVERPAVLWFGESYDGFVLETVRAALERAHVCIVIGSSGQVSLPVALAREARRSGAMVVEVNLERSEFSDVADFSFFDKAGSALPELWASWRKLVR